MVKILVPPKVAPFTFGSDPYQAEEFVSVTCSVSHGDLPINITWLFNGQPFESSEDIIIAKSGRRMSILSIESVSGNHMGNYSCIGTNLAGFDIHSSFLIVNGLNIYVFIFLINFR